MNEKLMNVQILPLLAPWRINICKSLASLPDFLNLRLQIAVASLDNRGYSVQVFAYFLALCVHKKQSTCLQRQNAIAIICASIDFKSMKAGLPPG